MNLVHLLPVGSGSPRSSRTYAGLFPVVLGVRCEILPVELDPAPAYHIERQQYHSSELLQSMQALACTFPRRVIGITAVDFYIPILKYVFGEVQTGGPCGIVSFHRSFCESCPSQAESSFLSAQ